MFLSIRSCASSWRSTPSIVRSFRLAARSIVAAPQFAPSSRTRIAYAGDACNGNTLLEFGNSLPVAEYMKSLLRLKEHQTEYDMVYGGHEIFDPTIVDEGIETVARVLAGTDDKCERTGMMGNSVLYAAEKVKNGYERVDGKRFNMSYLPEKVLGCAPMKQVITAKPVSMI